MLFVPYDCDKNRPFWDKTACFWDKIRFNWDKSQKIGDKTLVPKRDFIEELPSC